MSFLQGLRHRLQALLHPGKHAEELDQEFRFHLSLDAMQREHAAAGSLSPDDAAFAARRRFGNPTYLMEETRRMTGLGFFDVARQDLVFALRSFRRTPGFTLIAIMTLAIGIGANTAIFSAVNAMLLRPLPFTEPERLMVVSLIVPARGNEPRRDNMVWSYPKFVVFREAQTVFQDLSLYAEDQFILRGDGQAERSRGEYSERGYLTTLGVQPALGRNFLPEEDRTPGGPRVVLLSDVLWQRRFNADPDVLGKSLNIDGDPYTIVGVLPANFRGLSGLAEFWIPLVSQPADQLAQAWSHGYTLIARLKPGVSVEQAKAMLPGLGALVDRAYPHPEIHTEHWGATGRALDATRVDPLVRRSLLVLLGAVGLVLLIACANVANLFLVRASGRRREIAVRLAVGAGRGRLVRQLLTESVLLAVAGGVASVVVAWWGVHLLSHLDPASTLPARQFDGLGAVNFTSIHLDLAALCFTASLALATGILFGLVPALQATRPSLQDGLKSGSTASAVRSSGGSFTRSVLAIVEIALALVLLAGSGLMLRSLGKLLGVDPGFVASHVLTLRLRPPNDFGRDSLPGFYDQILERIAALPGVTGVALGNCAPLSGGCNGTVVALRDRPPVTPGSEPEVGVEWITPSWTTVLKVPLIRGRMFTEADRKGSPKVVVIGQTAANRIWPGEDPIGRPVSVGQGGFWNDTARVIGVIGDVRFGTLDSLPRPEAYLSYYQSPYPGMMLFVRTAVDPVSLAPTVRQALNELSPDSPIYDVRTLESRASDAMAYARFSTVLLVLFGVVALALAAMGIYGVISFAVAQRTHEIGIRVALGATRRDVVRLVVRQGLALAMVGSAFGVVAAFGATRVLESLLYDVAPSDPLTFAGIVGVLALAVLAACWIPARRATGIQPAEALREG